MEELTRCFLDTLGYLAWEVIIP